MALKFQQTLQQRLVLAPNMTMALRILRMPTLELQTFLHQQAETNPILELEDSMNPPQSEPDGTAENQTESPNDYAWEDQEWYSSWGNGRERESATDEDRPSWEQSLSKPTSLHESLLAQLGCQQIPDEKRQIGEFLIYHLDDNGYLDGTLEGLSETLDIPEKSLAEALKIVQSLDPSGVGARNLRECLMIQLEQRGEKRSLPYRILAEHFEAFTQHRFSAIARATRESLEVVEAACADIKKLNPKPGSLFSTEPYNTITPDLIIHKREAHYDVELTDQRVPHVGINRYYYRMLRDPSTNSDVKEFLHNKFRQASWVIKAIDERNSTLLAIARCLISMQRDFLEKGMEGLRPLTQAKVASIIGRHPSTVSRAIAGKTIDTPFGVYRLEELFATAIQNEDEDAGPVSDANVKAQIKALIENEDPNHPLSDETIANTLKKAKLSIARRTVAKYRTTLKILPAHLRRKRRG